MGEAAVVCLARAKCQAPPGARAARGCRLPEPGEAAERDSAVQHALPDDATFTRRSSRALDASLSWPNELLRISHPDDAAEREAERVADSVVQSMSTQTATVTDEVPVTPSDGSLDAVSKRRFEPQFGDLSDVRIHTDSNAAESARNLRANAFTIGNDISFATRKYAPESTDGQRLLAHELAHVKSPAASAGVLHRDLAGYTSEHLQVQSFGQQADQRFAGQPPIFDVTSADAATLYSALSALITAGKIGTSTRGDLRRFWSTGGSLSDVEAAFAAAAFPRAHDMAVSLLDGTRIAVYSHNERVYVPGLIWDTNISNTSQNIKVQTRRGLTNDEITAATEVFGTSLNDDSIVLEEDPIMSIGGYARTTPWTINLPVGTLSGGMSITWLLHEMGHSWQYAHGVGLGTTLRHAINGVYDYGGETELAARTARGDGLRSFNTEQQADIAKDAYLAIHHLGGHTLSVYQPYIDEFHTGYK